MVFMAEYYFLFVPISRIIFTVIFFFNEWQLKFVNLHLTANFLAVLWLSVISMRPSQYSTMEYTSQFTHNAWTDLKKWQTSLSSLESTLTDSVSSAVRFSAKMINKKENKVASGSLFSWVNENCRWTMNKVSAKKKRNVRSKSKECDRVMSRNVRLF